MTRAVTTPLDEAHQGQRLEDALALAVRCARSVPFYRRSIPEVDIRSVDEFASVVPLSSRVDLASAAGLDELVSDVRAIFRSLYPYHQNVGTFPFQVVAGERDLVLRHERMTAVLDAAGFARGGESVILVSPPQYFFASDLCAEIFFEGHHCSIQDVTGMGPPQIAERIEAFGAELVVVATDSPAIVPAAFPTAVRGVITFRGAHGPLARDLEATVVDVYGLTEAPYLGHRVSGERCYRCNPDHFYIERSPAGLLTVTSLLWELMPLVRYQTYDWCGLVDDENGLFEIVAYGEW